MKKLFAVSGLVCLCLCCLAATAAAKPVQTKVSIRAYPGGVFGYVSSTDTQACSADRQVRVYEQTGSGRDPKSDRRVGSDLAETSEDRFMWTVDTGESGRFYAGAPAAKGCAAALSGTVEAATTPVLGGDQGPQYPVCGPYVSEGTSEICQFGQLYLSLEQEGPFSYCRFGSSSGNCPGDGFDAPYPWGVTFAGGHTRSRIYWQPEGSVRSVVIVSYAGKYPEGDGAAHLGGHLPSSNSDRFTVTDGFAQSDAGYPNGDHFFTPDLPGQGPGEVGGPLSFNFRNGSGTDAGAQLWVQGYLYLTH